MNIEIANRLVALRKANGLSQEALAEKLGISRQAISKWERAEASPDTDNLMALASLYGMTLDDLLNTQNDAYVLDGANGEAQAEKTEKLPKTALQKHGRSMLKFPFPLVVIVVYLVFGFVWHLWHPAWLIFLFIPIYYHLAGALTIRGKKARALTMPVPEIIVLVYLTLGFLAHLWNPSWILFLLIPLYYWIVACFYKPNKAAEQKPENEQK